jgi:hypothetical protein
MTNIQEAVSTLGARRAELAALEEATARAEALSAELEALQADLAAAEAKRDRLASLGSKRVLFEEEAVCPISGLKLALEPRRSRETGAELAARFDKTLDPLRDAISQRETLIAELLAPAA